MNEDKSMTKEGSKKEEFKRLELYFTSELFPRLRVSRSRTSAGGADITLFVGSHSNPKSADQGRITFGEGSGDEERLYVEEVRELARLLIEAADEPCSIE